MKRITLGFITILAITLLSCQKANNSKMEIVETKVETTYHYFMPPDRWTYANVPIPEYAHTFDHISLVLTLDVEHSGDVTILTAWIEGNNIETAILGSGRYEIKYESPHTSLGAIFLSWEDVGGKHILPID